MVTRAQQICMLRLRGKIANYGHAMPIGLGVLGYKGGIVVFDSLTFAFASGRRVPISWGSPPIQIE